MQLHPYVGITKFTQFSQVRAMRRVFARYAATPATRALHVGAMMSYKTLHGIPSKWTNVFPDKENIADIFASADPKIYNCLHFADYDGLTDFKVLCQAITCGGIHLKALQLDMIWPDPGWIWLGTHASRRPLEVILQIGRRAFYEAGDCPEGVVEKLEDYEDVVHRILLDRSGGEGIGMDARRLLPFARAIRKRFPRFGLVVAGGLGPDTMDLAKPLIEEFPDISIDAQGKLHTWNMAANYLRAALRMCNQRNG